MKNKLDLLSTNKLVDLFISEEIKSLQNLKKQKSNIVKAIPLIKKCLNKKGRVIYIGAGTSGRLGILDAVECRPTFSTNFFTAIMAGGKNAFLKAKEGAEDNKSQAIKDLKKIKLSRNDILIGISASGETLYTLSAIKYGKKHRISTIGITSNPESSISKIANISISPEIKREIVLGSTRLKSGTVQKIILNTLSSIAMIQSGKVYDNFMIDVQPTNKKLIKRAIGIISNICEVSLNKAKILFIKAKRNTKAAIVMHYKRCSLEEASYLLKEAHNNLRKIIG